MLSDIQIAQQAKLKRVDALAADRLGITDEHLEPYGYYKAKVALNYLRHAPGPSRRAADPGYRD